MAAIRSPTTPPFAGASECPPQSPRKIREDPRDAVLKKSPGLGGVVHRVGEQRPPGGARCCRQLAAGQAPVAVETPCAELPAGREQACRVVLGQRGEREVG